MYHKTVSHKATLSTRQHLTVTVKYCLSNNVSFPYKDISVIPRVDKISVKYICNKNVLSIRWLYIESLTMKYRYSQSSDSDHTLFLLFINDPHTEAQHRFINASF